MNKYHSPFWTIVRKEVSDHVRSWRFLILIGIIALTCMGSLYTALTNIGAAIKPNDPDGSFFFSSCSRSATELYLLSRFSSVFSVRC